MRFPEPAHDDVDAILEFEAVPSDVLQDSSINQIEWVIRNTITSLYGYVGAGTLDFSLLSTNQNSVYQIKCNKSHYSFLRSILAYVTNFRGKPCAFRPINTA